ncbi:MAG: hypothetical protein H6737_30830 [Alphaproteobacteria bacterium]|nr:hypothetical protein [Alphaproteobacteria bacterium]
MGRRGRNRDKRDLVLAQIEEADPALYQELVELRGSNPNAYRRRIRKLGETYVIRSPQKLMANRSAMWHASDRTDFDVLDEHFQIIRAAVKRGYFDERLDELAAHEKQGRDRPVIYQIVQERREWLEYAASPKPAMPPAGGNWVRAKEPSD